MRNGIGSEHGDILKFRRVTNFMGFPSAMNNCSNLMTRRLSGFLKNEIDNHMSIRLMDTRSCQFCFNPLCLVRAFVWYRSRFF